MSLIYGNIIFKLFFEFVRTQSLEIIVSDVRYSIPFNKPTFLGEEIKFVEECLRSNRICGDNSFSRKCGELLQERFGSPKALLTTSCTSALEMAALLLNIQPGDEVICPSFTFVTSASAFSLRGAKLVFVDIRKDTLNIDEQKIEEAVTDKTRAIVVVHYAGVACEMDAILRIGEKYGIAVVEDAAQAIGSTYKNKFCGCIAQLGCFSFHETKNIVCGEGGALLVNDPELIERAEIIREKGTNRSKFHRGQVDKYTWVELGSSYLPSDICAAYLYPQLLKLNKINAKRMDIWNKYHEGFARFEASGLVKRPHVPDECRCNGHMYYLVLNNLDQRTQFIEYMKKQGILTVFHYVPLHSSPAGTVLGRQAGDMAVTNQVSDCLVRLPMFYALEDHETDYILEQASIFLGAQ